MYAASLTWILLLGVSALSTTPIIARPVKQWYHDMPPAPGAPFSIGSYTSGCIQGAEALPSTGAGYQTIRRSQRRFFGHPTLIQYIRELGHFVDQNNLGILSIGDLGQARGGPIPSAHQSHQTGLDADIWFWLQPKSQPMSSAALEAAQPPSMVTQDRLALHPANWTPRQIHLMKAAASFESVERIFVTPLVKQALCQAFPGATWLSKVRPWWGHRAHFHVRLRCPQDGQGCVNQPPPPEGDGCGADLAWWFSDEAKQPPPSKPKAVELPAACLAILAQ
jgi:penicillin-insensitive murein endopeptidase